MSGNTPLLTVAVLLKELSKVTDWRLLGAYLDVPVHVLDKIDIEHDGVVEHCKMYMLQYWLDTTMTASWNDMAGALEQLNMLTLATRLKLKYLRTSPVTAADESAKNETGVPAAPLPQQDNDETDPTIDDAAVEANVKVISDLQGLENDFSDMMTDTRKDLRECDIAELQFYLDDLFGVDEFRKCQNIDEVLRKLRRDHIDTFNVRYLEQLISRFHKNEAIVKKIEEYEEKKEEFLRATTVKEFQQAVISKAESVTPKGMAAVTIKIPEEYSVPRTMKDVEKLAKKGFKGVHKDFVKINVKPGSFIITWYVPEALYGEIVRLARENAAVLKEEGVEEVSIAGEKSVTLSTEDGREVNLDINEQMIADLSTKLRITEERLQATNRELIEQRNELEQRRRIVADLETNLNSVCSSLVNQVQVTGERKNVATVGEETSFELSLSSPSATSPIPFPIDQLCCQLTDPHHQHIHCSITSTQPGVCTVKYTPTLPGPHQLRITIRDTDIPGSPFTVNAVLTSPEMRGVVKHTISGDGGPCGVAVSNSGEVVVSECSGCCISVYSREGKKIRTFGSKGYSTGQFLYPRGVAITSDNHILVADGHNHRIQMYTMEGWFVKSAGQYGKGQLQFNIPSGIAVHPSGRVLVADTGNHRIQVLNPDLSYSHMFGSKGSAPGQFRNPCDVAIDNNGVIYVTDKGNHRVQFFTGDGEFISTFGSEGSQHGQLYQPVGVGVDSTNTVYVTDYNHRVSVYTSSGQFIKCFGTQGSGEGELDSPRGVAVDNTTGALYVCDFSNYMHRIVVY